MLVKITLSAREMQEAIETYMNDRDELGDDSKIDTANWPLPDYAEFTLKGDKIPEPKARADDEFLREPLEKTPEAPAAPSP